MFVRLAIFTRAQPPGIAAGERLFRANSPLGDFRQHMTEASIRRATGVFILARE